MGRPNLITTDHIRNIGYAAELGFSPELAADYAGISRRTLFNWLKRGENEPDTIYGDFHQAYRAGIARSVAENLQNILRAAAAGDWRASAWLLERRYGYHRSMSVDIQARLDVQMKNTPTTAEEHQQLILDVLSTLPAEYLQAELDSRRVFED